MKNMPFSHFFGIVDCGIELQASVICSMISNSNSSRAELQKQVDAIKQYMKLRNVDRSLEQRVIRWYDYLATNRHTTGDDTVLAYLPHKLQVTALCVPMIHYFSKYIIVNEKIVK